MTIHNDPDPAIDGAEECSYEDCDESSTPWSEYCPHHQNVVDAEAGLLSDDDPWTSPEVKAEWAARDQNDPSHWLG
jgi:hypothetical protein